MVFSFRKAFGFWSGNRGLGSRAGRRLCFVRAGRPQTLPSRNRFSDSKAPKRTSECLYSQLYIRHSSVSPKVLNPLKPEHAIFLLLQWKTKTGNEPHSKAELWHRARSHSIRIWTTCSVPNISVLVRGVRPARGLAMRHTHFTSSFGGKIGMGIH